jgi:transcriptional regulator with XRE-family HTH domain
MAEQPSRLRRQLGQELQSLREQAGINQAQMMQRLEDAGHRVRSQPALSRHENGRQIPSLAMVDAWTRITGAKAADRDRVLVIAEAVHMETRPWRDVDDGPHLQGVAGRREEESQRIRDCSLTWIPGLCQTAEYARQFIPQVDPEHSIDHAAAVAARMERQQILYREGRRFQLLISEHALRWQPGPGVMAGQRAHLTVLAGLAAVDLRVLRADRVGAPEWINFVLYDPVNGDDPFVATELPQGGQAPTDTKIVSVFEDIWSSLWSAAVAGEDAVEFIRSVSG